MGSARVCGDSVPRVHVLVTGGAGFIGSHVVEALHARGDEVVVLDALAPDVHATAEPHPPDGIELHRADVRDAAAVAAALRGVDAVSHQAAMVGLGVDLGDLPAYVSHNDFGTAVLLSQLAAARFAGRLVLASSMVVHGPRMPCDTPYAGVASVFRSALQAGRAPRVFEDGRQRRDFVHVSDVARANVLAPTVPEPVSGPLNVASGDPRGVGDLAEALAANTPGAPEPVVTGAFRLGDVRHVFASPERAARLLGFRAEIAFADGVREFAKAPLRAAVV